jgi:hypothetical protein
MKLQCSVVLIVLAAFVTTNAFGGSFPSDDRFFTLMNEAFEAQGQAAVNLAQKRTNAEAFCLLAMKASQTQILSNMVRLTVADSAVQAFIRYLSAMPHTATDWKEFAAPDHISMALFLLEDSHALLARIPLVPAALNVDPPLVPNVTLISGMDPKGIPDPAARAEYERRIAENNRAIELDNALIILERSTQLLENYLQSVIWVLGPEGEPLKAAVKASRLPPESKALILDEKRTLPTKP